MKQLQNNYTTPEQSKQLLELGVPADSADCYYCKDANRPLANFIRDLLPEDVNYSVRCSNHLMYDYLPCWSVGRLIEIYEICTGYEWHNVKGNKIEGLLSNFKDHKHLFDFSKLETKK